MPLWIPLALVAAFSMAGLVLANEVFKVRAVHLLFWMRVFATLALLPGIAFFEWPGDARFYLFMLASASIFAYVDTVLVGLSAKSGAGVVSRMDPLTVGVTFLVWLVLSPSLAVAYAEEPLRAAGIIASLGGSMFFAFRLRKCSVTLEALKVAMPAILLAALGIVTGKFALEAAGGGERRFLLRLPAERLYGDHLSRGALFAFRVENPAGPLSLVKASEPPRACRGGLCGAVLACPCSVQVVCYRAGRKPGLRHRHRAHDAALDFADLPPCTAARDSGCRLRARDRFLCRLVNCFYSILGGGIPLEKGDFSCAFGQALCYKKSNVNTRKSAAFEGLSQLLKRS